MSWNYRVFRITNPDNSGFYEIREAYYKDGVVTGWTDSGSLVGADTSLDLLTVLAMMGDALGHPILDAVTGQEIEPARELSDDLRRALKSVGRDLFEVDFDAPEERTALGLEP